MADFAAFVTAAEHLGWKAGQAVEDLKVNRAHLNELPLEHSVIVPAIRKVIASGELLGTATEILAQLDAAADQFDESARRQRKWPKTAAALGSRARTARAEPEGDGDLRGEAAAIGRERHARMDHSRATSRRGTPSDLSDL